MGRKKRQLTKEEKAKIIDMSLKGYPRTKIARELKMKNTTLEQLCEENDINLNKKGTRAHTKDNISGVAVIKGDKLYFKNSKQLYFLLKWEAAMNITKVSQYDDNSFKIESFLNFPEFEIKIDSMNEEAFATNAMIKNAVEQKKIKFMDSYMNKKWNIDYEL